MQELVIVEKDGRTRKAEEALCENCWKPFLRRKSSKQRFCSKTCVGSSRSRAFSTHCSQCGRVVVRSATKAMKNKSGHFFCSRMCHNEAQKLESGISVQPSHYGTGLSSGKTLAQTFDLGSCCVVCGESAPYKLTVHHIDGDRTHNRPENLELVCWNCHSHRHLRLVDDTWSFSTRSLTPREIVMRLDEEIRARSSNGRAAPLQGEG